MKGANLHLASVFLVPCTPTMKTLCIPYPESLLGSLHVSEGEFERESRMAMAVKLFDTGRLSSGQAADLADMPRVHFLYELGRWRVSALQTSEDELESDLNVAGTLHDRHQH
jgi:predicted HTH domain antitoxin